MKALRPSLLQWNTWALLWLSTNNEMNIRKCCTVTSESCGGHMRQWSWMCRDTVRHQASPSSQGAQDSMMPSLADLRMDSGRGIECLTIAPYSPYSAITVLRPQHFSLFLHLALRFWNHTCDKRTLVTFILTFTWDKNAKSLFCL